MKLTLNGIHIEWWDTFYLTDNHYIEKFTISCLYIHVSQLTYLKQELSIGPSGMQFLPCIDSFHTLYGLYIGRLLNSCHLFHHFLNHKKSLHQYADMFQFVIYEWHQLIIFLFFNNVLQYWSAVMCDHSNNPACFLSTLEMQGDFCLFIWTYKCWMGISQNLAYLAIPGPEGCWISE